MAGMREAIAAGKLADFRRRFENDRMIESQAG
jgi:hypothetical protein